jgi:hypothetical protein
MQAAHSMPCVVTIPLLAYTAHVQSNIRLMLGQHTHLWLLQTQACTKAMYKHQQMQQHATCCQALQLHGPTTSICS